MKEYYKLRWHWIFNYTSKNFGYCLLKTLCLVVGLPIYSVMFVLEMVLTAINMLFCWIPILNTVILVICKSLMFVFGSTFYLCILTDIKKYKQLMAELSQEEEMRQLTYEIADAEVTDDATTPTETLPSDETSNETTVDSEEK